MRGVMNHLGSAEEEAGVGIVRATCSSSQRITPVKLAIFSVEQH
jgi:hypothetical protein